MEKEILHRWINELGVSRKDLPYELVSVFSDSGGDDFRAAVDLGLGHVGRVLDFCCLLDEENWESDDFWFYLLATLDCCSYYASLSMPLARQIIEPDAGLDDCYLVAARKTEPEFSIHEIISVPHDLTPGEDVKSRKKTIAAANSLALNLKKVREEYRNLICPEELKEWCKYYLYCCADIIMLAMSQSLRRKGVSPVFHEHP